MCAALLPISAGLSTCLRSDGGRDRAERVYVCVSGVWVGERESRSGKRRYERIREDAKIKAKMRQGRVGGREV